MQYYDIIKNYALAMQGIDIKYEFDEEGLYYIEYNPYGHHTWIQEEDFAGYIGQVGILRICVYVQDAKEPEPLLIYQEIQGQNGKFLKDGPWEAHLPVAMGNIRDKTSLKQKSNIADDREIYQTAISLFNSKIESKPCQ